MTENDLALKAWPAAERVARAFAAGRPGTDPDAALSEAGYALLLAIRKFDGRGTLEQYVGYRVRKALLKAAERGRLSVRGGASREVLNALPARRYFDLDRFLNHLSADAGRLVRIALAAGERTRTLNKLRKLGWLRCSVETVFREIREALQ